MDFTLFKCKQPGESVRTDKGGTVLSFPFSQNNPKGPERMHQSTIEDAKQAVLTNKPCNGVKGPSWLAGLKHYDIIEGTGIDYMHCCSLMLLWYYEDVIKFMVRN